MIDYYGDLIRVTAKDEGEAHKQSEAYIAEIRQQIRQLQEQLDHVSGLRDYLSKKLNLISPTDAARGDRPRHILEAADALVDKGQKTITVRMVLDELASGQIDLGVQQPNAVIATVLGWSESFRRVDTNTFEHEG